LGEKSSCGKATGGTKKRVRRAKGLVGGFKKGKKTNEEGKRGEGRNAGAGGV